MSNDKYHTPSFPASVGYKRDPLGQYRKRLESLKHWQYDPQQNALLLGFKGCIYDIGLDRCNSNAQIMDFFAQVAKKDWATAEIVGELVIAVNALLDLQGHLCGCAIGSPHKDIDGGKLAVSRYKQMLKERP